MSIPPARQDGRPLYFDTGGFSGCEVCKRMGVNTVYAPGQHFLSDRANSPFGSEDTGVYVVCMGHVPANAVIFNPLTGECRNKAGTKTWREDGDLSEAIRVGDRVLVSGQAKDNVTGELTPVVRKATVTGTKFRAYAVTFDNGETAEAPSEIVRKLNPKEGMN